MENSPNPEGVSDSSDSDIINSDQGDDYDNDDIFTAVRSGDVKRVAKCLERGEDINSHEDDNLAFTPLMVAVWVMKDVSMTRFLLKNGASVMERVSYNWTALHWAANIGHVEIMRLLLKKGKEIVLVSFM